MIDWTCPWLGPDADVGPAFSPCWASGVTHSWSYRGDYVRRVSWPSMQWFPRGTCTDSPTFRARTEPYSDSVLLQRQRWVSEPDQLMHFWLNQSQMSLFFAHFEKVLPVPGSCSELSLTTSKSLPSRSKLGTISFISFFAHRGKFLL